MSQPQHHLLASVVFGLGLLFGTIGLVTAQDSASAAQPRVKITTTEGDIIVSLERRLAPASVENFLTYVDAGFYNGTIFHRVINNFMIQGGGFTADYQRKPTESPIRNEANNGLKNEKYTLAMARTNAPHSATSQFFINTVVNDYLDHTDASPRGWGYAVFGRVDSGQEIVDRIAQVATGVGGPFSRDAPLKPIVIEAITRVEDTALSAGTNAATTPETKTE